MAIEFSCPHCQQLVRTPLTAAGKKGKCPKCNAVVQIPARWASKSERPAAVPQQSVGGSASSSSRWKEESPGTIEFYCTHCGQLVRTPAATGGKRGKCPNCQELVQIPQRTSGSTSMTPLPARTTPRPFTPTDDLTPLEELEPLNPPPRQPDLAPLLDEALPPLPQLPPLPPSALPTLPATGWSEQPAAAAHPPAHPRRWVNDLGRRGLPWERDPSLDSFIDTVRYILGAPGDAFLTMTRRGMGSAVGFFLLSAVMANLLAAVLWTALQFAMVLLYIAMGYFEGDPNASFTIRWDIIFYRFAGMACAGIFIALLQGTIGGLFWAGIYHVCLLLCGAAQGGFTTTYRVVSFGLGSLMMLGAIPIVGPVFSIVMMPIVLTYGFMNAHETSGGRAFVAAILPLLFVLCLCGAIGLAFTPQLFELYKEALARARQS
jgi:phage FluMu protein Com